MRALLPQLVGGGGNLTAARAGTGYRDATDQTWIASSAGGTPYVTIVVQPSGSGFAAGPDSLCAR